MRHVNLTSKEKYSCQSHKLWEFRHSICRTKFAAESLSEITCSKEDGRVHVMCSALAELGFVLFTPFVILQLKKKKRSQDSPLYFQRWTVYEIFFCCCVPFWGTMYSGFDSCNSGIE